MSNTNEYKPKSELKEALKRMYKETKDDLYIPKKILGGTLEGIAAGLSLGHAIPTAIRICKEDNISQGRNIKDILSRGLPRAISLFGTIGQEIYVYSYLFHNYGAKALAIPLVTNLGSICYESYRKNKEKVREELNKRWPGAT
jgi:hypothetical protein